MHLGEFGIWTSYRSLGRENAGEAARQVEELGFGALWLGGSPQLEDVAPLLEATERIVIATGILNVWQHEPPAVAAICRELSERFGDRLLLGIGIGHREATPGYARPLAAMGAFLDGLDAAEPPLGAERRCLAALRPRMLSLSAERSLGAHTYFVPVEHTRRARSSFGTDPLLAPELACVLDEDSRRARAAAREYAGMYLRLSNYTGNLRELGFGEEDVAPGGSDRLIDAVVPHGSAERIAQAARAHREAGADHVCVQVVGVRGVPRDEWASLAAALGLTP